MSLSNPSGLRPLGHALLLKTFEMKQGVIEIPEHVKKSMVAADQSATVIEIGPMAWDGEPTPRAKVGDKVLFTKFAGYTAVGPKDGETYRIVNDRDVFLRIEE